MILKLTYSRIALRTAFLILASRIAALIILHFEMELIYSLILGAKSLDFEFEIDFPFGIVLITNTDMKPLSVVVTYLPLGLQSSG